MGLCTNGSHTLFVRCSVSRGGKRDQPLDPVGRSEEDGAGRGIPGRLQGQPAHQDGECAGLSHGVRRVHAHGFLRWGHTLSWPEFHSRSWELGRESNQRSDEAV